MAALLAEGNTVAERFLHTAALFAHRPALREKRAGAWTDTSYAVLGERVLDLAAALRARGLQRGDRFAIWLETTADWVALDLAANLIGAVTTAIYHLLPPGQAAALLADSGARALASTGARLASLQSLRAGLGALEHCVAVDAGGDATLAQLEADGRRLRRENPAVDQELRRPTVRPEDLSAIIYTSGTTGEPKGAMLTHRNVLANADGCIQRFYVDALPAHPEWAECRTFLLHLPLAHVMSRNTLMLTSLFGGNTLAMAEPEREKLPQNLLEVRPHAFLTVPFLLDKFRAGVLAAVASKGALAQRLFARAMELGRRERLPGPDGRPPDRRRESLALRLLDRLVLRGVRARLGGRVDHLVIGGASSNLASVEFFWSLGIRIYEGYGATEVTNCATYTTPGCVRLGTVGRPAPGMEVKLAPDGEVLTRGPNVMQGYWNKPDATAQAIDPDGYYRTGDIGELDGDGFLRIVDRKKEILVLATGKKVAPQAVENCLKRSPLFLNAMAVGEGRNFVIALLAVDEAVLRDRLGEGARATDARAAALIESELLRGCEPLADFERPKKWAIVPEPFSLENGMLTPTLKLRRKPILERYAALVEPLYGEAARRTGS
jgi:long-chain acyl-CoA synthetase